MKRLLLSLIAVLALTACTPQASTPAEAPASAVVQQVIMSRRSIRQFHDQPISRDTLDQILRCGINAPSGQNRQAYEIRVVDDPALLSQITDAVLADHPGMTPQQGASNIFVGSRCVIFIAHDTTYDVSQVDCGLLGQNIMLSAWSMGIGSCCMAFPTRLISESPSCAPYLAQLGFSQGYRLLYCLAMGYPAESPDAKPRRDDMIRYVQ